MIRHGESEGNADETIYNVKPDYALYLTETGREQARNAGIRLKQIIGNETAYFYVSPMWRTRMTFEEIARQLDPHQVAWNEEPRLREQEWGHLRTLDETYATRKLRDEYGIFYYRIPLGESGADVYDRVSDFFGSLFRDFDKDDFPDNAIMITHGMTIRLFLMRWFHYTVEHFEALANPRNCDIVILQRNEKGTYDLITEMKMHNVFHAYQRPLQLNNKG